MNEFCDKTEFHTEGPYNFFITVFGIPKGKGGLSKNSWDSKEDVAYVKEIIEHMIMTENQKSTNEIFEETYEIFKSLPIKDIAFVMGVRDYEKYSIH